MQSLSRFNVLGVGLNRLTMRGAVETILDRLASGRKGYVCVTGVHGVMEAQADPALRDTLNGSFLNTTDGMPLVWIGRRGVADREVDRIYGPDLMLATLAATQDGRFTHFLYGGAPGVAEQLKTRLEAKFPGIQIVGTFCPPFRPLRFDEERELIEQLQRLKPSIVWVGLSTPKQERFMRQYLDRLDTTLMFGVGAAFDFHAGRVKQAPTWMRHSGLEWLYRLSQEPRRLWRRYLSNNPRFVWKFAWQALGITKYSLHAGEPLVPGAD